MLRKATSKAIVKFLFSVMCRFGCILHLVTDGGSEFRGALTALAEEYKVPIVKISAYSPQANGMVEHGHDAYLNSIWRSLKGFTHEWPLYFKPALLADRVTAKRTTGCTPYYLLYSQHPLFPFDISDRTWHTLTWHDISLTEELLTY